MAQAQESEKAAVKLRVVGEKFMESVTKSGRIRVVAAPWLNNQVIHNKKSYGPGETFEVGDSTNDKGKVVKTADQVAKELLATGSVQKASDKPKPFRPPSLEHKVTLQNGIVLRDDVLGKQPTRMMGEAQNQSDWEGDDYDQGY